MPDSHPRYRLGKLPPRPDARTLRLERFLEPQLPPIPESLNLSQWVHEWPLYRNGGPGAIGDCTIAARAHMVELWTALGAAQPTVPAEDEVVQTYLRLTGGPDSGLVELDVLNDWRRNPTAGMAIYAFVAVDPANHDHVKHAAALFGGLYLGLALPESAATQIDAGQTWDVPQGGLVGQGAPASWGRHAVNLADFNDDGVTVVTWGKLQRLTWAFWDAATASDRYVEEVWALLPGTWQTSTPSTLGGLKFAALNEALDALRAA